MSSNYSYINQNMYCIMEKSIRMGVKASKHAGDNFYFLTRNDM